MSNNEFLRIGPRIARTRKVKGLTQMDLAARMNIEQQMISRYEKDTAGNMSLKKIEEFALALEVDPAELLGTGGITIHAENCSPTNGSVGYNSGAYHIQHITPEMLSLMDELKHTQKDLLSAKDELIARLRTENEQLRYEVRRGYLTANEDPE